MKRATSPTSKEASGKSGRAEKRLATGTQPCSIPPIFSIAPELFFENIIPLMVWKDVWAIGQIGPVFRRHFCLDWKPCSVVESDSDDSNSDDFESDDSDNNNSNDRLHYKNHCLECLVKGMHGGLECYYCQKYASHDDFIVCRFYDGDPGCLKRRCPSCAPVDFCECSVAHGAGLCYKCCYPPSFSFIEPMGRHCRCKVFVCPRCDIYAGSCDQCGQYFCKTCNALGRCKYCDEYMCLDRDVCSSKVTCVACHEAICKNCADYFLHSCKQCSRVFCEGCDEDMDWCEVCNESVCPDCTSKLSCGVCGGLLRTPCVEDKAELKKCIQCSCSCARDAERAASNECDEKGETIDGLA